MVATILDPVLQGELIEKRRATGADRYDEVWEGVYVMSPLANDEHQRIATRLAMILENVIGVPELGEVRAGINVSDRKKAWKRNFRCPDVVVYLKGTGALNCGTHWCGGPDFCVEIISPHDKTRDKLPFYAQIGTRELLIIDRDPWSLEFYRLQEQRLLEVGRSTLDRGDALVSEVVPLTMKLIGSQVKPRIEVAHSDTDQCWVI